MMTRTQILSELRQFFNIEELVCKHTLAEWGERAWQFLATDYLHALLVIRRDILQKPMYCNGNGRYQRGLRCNICPLVAEKNSVYLSAHILGKAGDFTVEGMSASEARAKIKERAHMLPCNIRLEDNVDWLHIDTRPQEGDSEKVYIFAK